MSGWAVHQDSLSQRLQELDFLEQCFDTSYTDEFRFKDNHSVRVWNCTGIALFQFQKAGAWLHLHACFDKLPKEVQEMVVWNLDVFESSSD